MPLKSIYKKSFFNDQKCTFEHFIKVKPINNLSNYMIFQNMLSFFYFRAALYKIIFALHNDVLFDKHQLEYAISRYLQDSIIQKASVYVTSNHI